MPQPPKLASMQAGRGIAALLIVVQHVSYFVGGSPAYWHRTRIFRAFNGTALGVEFFFVLSGAVMVLSHRKDFGHPARLRSFLWRRFRRIYPIYWIVLGLWLAVGLAAHRPLPHLRDLVSNVLLIHLGSLGLVLVVAWTLFQEVLFYVVLSVLILHRRSGAVLMGAWMAGSAALLFVHTSSAVSFLLSPLNLLFGLGMLAAPWLGRPVRRPGFLLAAGVVLFLVCTVAAVRWTVADPRVALTAGVASCLCMVGGAGLEDAGRMRVPKSFGFMGDASYAIYLLHYPALVAFAPLAFWGSRMVGGSVLLWATLLCLTAAGAGCAFHVMVERPLLRAMPK